MLPSFIVRQRTAKWPACPRVSWQANVKPLLDQSGIEVIMGTGFDGSLTVIDNGFTLYGGGGNDYLNT